MSFENYHSQSTSYDTDKEGMVVCPYDPMHKISAKRYVRHILKCRKNHPNMIMGTCPFNARHIVPKPDLRHHINNCPDKRLLEIDMNHQSDPSEQQLIRSSEHLDFQTDEDWTKVEEVNEHASEPFIPSSFPTTVSAPTEGKKVNARREAIKRMKAKMKEEMYKIPEPVPQLTRPAVPENRFDPRPYMFVHDSLIDRNLASNQPNLLEKQDQSGKVAERKFRPMLAANFSFNGHTNGCAEMSQLNFHRNASSSGLVKKSFPAVGRGRQIPNRSNIFGTVNLAGLSQIGNDKS